MINTDKDNKTKPDKRELNMDELEMVTGGKGVNTALTEIDEEGIDVGGEYKLEFNSSWIQTVYLAYSGKDDYLFEIEK